MPTYEYACQACGTHVEVYQRFSDPPLSECGVCGGPLRKVFHPAGILFKGSGFYATDNRRAGSSSSERKREETGKASGTASGSGPAEKRSAGKDDAGSAPKPPPTPSSGTEKSA